MSPTDFTRVPAIVLCRTGTGMATVRALAEAGVEVHAFIFRTNEPIRRSRHAHKVFVPNLENARDELIDYLIEYSKRFAVPPVVLPTSDEHALLLAEHRERLSAHCRIWNNDHDDLCRIVNKDRLYAAAQHVGLPVVPSIYRASAAEIVAWSEHNAPPYLLKPPFEGAVSSPLRDKNLQLATRDALRDYVQRNDTSALIVQRLLKGGDGHIYDCYGLCDTNGRVLGMASHRRLRQHAPDFGATCFGEIPSGLPPQQDEKLFAYTQALLNHVRYHGIFGIEWLHEHGTDNFYLIDFNARPFSSIGHLYDCGVNLPLLAHRDLLGDALNDVEVRPAVKHKYWLDFDRDLQTFRTKRQQGQLTTWQWLRSLLRTRSFAYWNLRDPGPSWVMLRNLLRHLGRFGVSRLTQHQRSHSRSSHQQSRQEQDVAGAAVAKRAAP